jgi:DNA-binding transcriptional LysR family regulator
MRSDAIVTRNSGAGNSRAKASVEVRGPISADLLGFVFEAAVHGAGIALLPDVMSVEAVARGLLEPVLPGWGVDGGAMHVVLPTGRYVPARVALLRDHLVAHLTRELNRVRDRAARRPRRRAPRRQPSRPTGKAASDRR